MTVGLLLLWLSNMSGQANKNPELPNVIAPSPSVASLMKFEEIPVDSYSGMPDVSVPLYSAPLKNGQSLDIKLGYHPASINRKQVASDTGLGWNLIAGGTISRTVRGVPDEVFDITGNNSGKVGIYRTAHSLYPNIFYDFMGLVESNSILSADPAMVNKYLWDVGVSSLYDTEHDLYQYNFMGYTGRFIIKKNQFGNLAVQKMDINRLKIENFYDPATYEPLYFIITDEKGNSYKFDVKEITHSSQFVSTSSPYSNSDNVSGNDNYTAATAFHLSELKDINGITAATFEYSQTAMKEMTSNSSSTYNYTSRLLADEYFVYNTAYDGFSWTPLPTSLSSSSQNDTYTKKLTGINITGTAKVSIGYAQGREDYNLVGAASTFRLDEVMVKAWDGSRTKKYKLEYYYSGGTLRKRMMLSRVKEYGSDDTVFVPYDFQYHQPPDVDEIGMDEWGYGAVDYNMIRDGLISASAAYAVAKTDVLEKMTLPTGGGIFFDYETNRYSHIGSEPLDNFDENLENWNFNYTSKQFATRNNNRTYFFETNVAQTAYLKAHTSAAVTDWFFNVYRLTYVNGAATYTSAGGINAGNDGGNTAEGNLELTPGLYYVEFVTPQIPQGSFTAGIDVTFKSRTLETKRYIHGGGIRIRSVNYFTESSFDADDVPSRKVNYRYHFFSDPTLQSGSLSFPRARYVYNKLKKNCLTVSYLSNPFSIINEYDIDYTVTLSTNNLSAVKTKGADVGYKNVSVWESDNGQKQLTYTSPIDFPEVPESIHLGYPFLPTLNIDHRRGLLLKETEYKGSYELPSTLKKVRETENTYVFDEGTINSGLRFYDLYNYQFSNFRGFSSYAQYSHFLGGANAIDCFFGEPSQFIKYSILTEAYGNPKINTTETTEFFYESSSTAATEVRTKSRYEYHPGNYQVSKKTDELASGDIMETRYFYPGDSSLSGEPLMSALGQRNMVSTPLKTVSYRNSEKLSEQVTAYKDWGAGFLAPELVKTAKGSNPAETRIRYNAIDTSNGNILEVEQEGGTKISYIWAYGKAFPVAKIENSSYAAIPSSLVTAIQTASNQPGNNEAAVLAALDALRQHTSMANALVSGYSYKQGVGISTAIDPKGYRTSFKYDKFGRLEIIRDGAGNVISENEYRYRTQNQ